MRVLQLLKTSTGAFWAYRQMSELVKQGVEVYVAMPRDGKLVPLYEEAGVKICYIDFSIKHIFESCKQLRKIVQQVNPDIIHSHFVLTTLVMRLALRGDKRPRIFQVPGPLHLESWFFRNAELALSQRNDYWVGSCLWTNERYRKSGISDDRIFLSYYGKTFINPPKIKGLIRSEYNIPDDAIIISLVAFIYPPKRYLGQRVGIKGHEDFVEAISELIKDNQKIYGVCIGGTFNGSVKYEQKIKKFGKKLCGDRLIFMGTRRNIVELFGDVDIAVNASYSENLGGASEPLLLGIPVIASNVGGLPDIVIDSQTGYLITPGKPMQIAEAVRKILNNPLKTEQMVEAGKIKVNEVLDFKKSVANIQNIYQKITKL